MPPDGGYPIDVEVTNNYAESIFSLDVTPDGGAIIHVFGSARVSGSSTERAGGFHGYPGTVLSLAASAESLGDTHKFIGLTRIPETNRTLQLIYDFDLATAEFTLGFGWKP